MLSVPQAGVFVLLADRGTKGGEGGEDVGHGPCVRCRYIGLSRDGTVCEEPFLFAVIPGGCPPAFRLNGADLQKGKRFMRELVFFSVLLNSIH